MALILQRLNQVEPPTCKEFSLDVSGKYSGDRAHSQVQGVDGDRARAHKHIPRLQIGHRHTLPDLQHLRATVTRHHHGTAALLRRRHRRGGCRPRPGDPPAVPHRPPPHRAAASPPQSPSVWRLRIASREAAMAGSATRRPWLEAGGGGVEARESVRRG